MKRVHQALVVAAVLSLPLVSHAASDSAPLTRAQVRAELIAAEQAGQYPYSNVHYPDPAPNAATTYVANKEAKAASYGPSTSGASASGTRTMPPRMDGGVRPNVDNIYRGR
jgi:Domain of unknown function (DUF4148)